VSKRRTKWLKRFLISAGILALVALAASLWFAQSWNAPVPPLPADTNILSLRPEKRDGRVRLGKSWAGEREGLPVVYLTGSHFEMGYAAGALLEQKIHTLEDEFLVMIRGYVPENWKVRLLKQYVLFRNRHLSQNVPLPYRQEIYGSTLGSSDAHPELGDHYTRFFNYHAAHDVSYMMIDNPLVSKAGCTSFGAWGDATRGGHLISGRNFDWEAAEVFSRDRVVVMCEPKGSIPFISLSWAGMAGVVSGMNRAGISVTVNGAPSELPDDIATPVAVLARDILEHASNLDAVLKKLRTTRVFVSTLWLVGSRSDGKFVVVEKTPTTTQVREPEANFIICANHFETPGLAESQRNREYREESTSESRHARLLELIHSGRGRIDAATSAEFLRDRNLPGGSFVGHGHRGTLNALIATHATVMDLTDGIFWAASPPHGLGKFVAFDVNDFTRELPDRAVPADATLASGEFLRASEAQKLASQAKEALKRGDAGTALELTTKAEALNAGFYELALLRGRALMKLGRRVEAAAALEAALKAQPAFLAERQEAEQLLREARSSSAP
jgi:isopenicillin-N N-acyltransferase like protein